MKTYRNLRCDSSLCQREKEKKNKSAPLFLVERDEHIQDILISFSFFKTCPMFILRVLKQEKAPQ